MQNTSKAVISYLQLKCLGSVLLAKLYFRRLFKWFCVYVDISIGYLLKNYTNIMEKVQLQHKQGNSNMPI